MNHYYTNNSELESEPNTFTFKYKGEQISFTSDIGVFSKNMIDYGSRVMLDAIQINNNQNKVLDVGCGYGTFGISLKKVYPHIKVDMVDVNDRALLLCKNNVEQNHLSDINVFKSYIYEAITDKYDIILTNPPIRAGKEVVHKILEESYQYLNTNGELWVVIQKKQGAPSTKKKMQEVFNNVEIVKKDKGYYILKSKKAPL
ncbi:MAG: class I SAM-dependent methyltransferase [Coprobacillaceae bacterium]